MKSEKEIEDFTKLAIQLDRMLGEFTELSKKKPNDPVNTFKLGLVNKLLDTANEIVDVANRPFEKFSRFEEDNMPSNSDVLVILSQYRVCLAKFFEEQTGDNKQEKHVWVIDGKWSLIQAPYEYPGLL